MSDDALVSVILPTHGRPQLVRRALSSALQQTLREIEIIVIIDGPDPSTDETITRFSDPRVRVIPLSHRVGPGAARNVGFRVATAPWVALLDDDDEWLPEKLVRQMAMAKCVSVRFPILGTRAYVKTPLATYVWPTRRPRPEEDLSDYLFTRTSLFMGEGWYATPSLLTRTELAKRFPFDETLRFGGDNDWLLRAASQAGARYDVLWEPLCIIYQEYSRFGVTNSVSDWRSSLAWASRQRDLFTARAYAGFCLKASHRAASAWQWRVFFEALWEAVRHGRPTMTDLIIFAGIWTIPRQIRRRLRAMYFQWKPSEPSADS